MGDSLPVAEKLSLSVNVMSGRNGLRCCTSYLQSVKIFSGHRDVRAAKKQCAAAFIRLNVVLKCEIIGKISHKNSSFHKNILHYMLTATYTRKPRETLKLHRNEMEM